MAAALVLLAALFSVAPAFALAQDPGMAAGADVSHKFEEGFEEKILGLVRGDGTGKRSADGGGPTYYDIAVIVAWDAGGSSDPAKAAVAGGLQDMGARSVYRAEALSFVLASVPVNRIHDIALRDEVVLIGDAERPIVPLLDEARETIHARSPDLPLESGFPVNGSGVVVAVMDNGINHDALNGKVLHRANCYSQPWCRAVGTQGINNDKGSWPDHGTVVAAVIAASGLAKDNGIARGVSLIDVIGADRSYNTGNMFRALDYAVKNRADVVNMSFGSNSTCADLFALTVNEAVLAGAVVVASSGNDGNYEGVSNPACAHNVISVGGLDDRGSGLEMYPDSNRGPAPGTKRMGVDVAAPGVDLDVVGYPPDSSSRSHASGTSIATPQAAAVAAMMLQAEPGLSPAEVRAAMLLGADWRGPVPCTSVQFERNNPGDNCSFARQPSGSKADNESSLGIVNNIGFGVLDAAGALGYADRGSPHLIMDHFAIPGNDTREYSIEVGDTSDPVKVIMTWFAYPYQDPNNSHITVWDVADLDFVVTAPGGEEFRADSARQNSEFVVFDPPEAGAYSVRVSGNGLAGVYRAYQEYALASTAEISAAPIKIAGAGEGTAVSGDEDAFAAADIDLSRIFRDPDRDAVGYVLEYSGESGVGEVVTYSVNGTVLGLERVPNANTGAGQHTLEVRAAGGVPDASYTITFDIEPLPDAPRLQNVHTISPDEGAVIDLDAGLYVHDPDTDAAGHGSYETVGVSGHSKKDDLFADHTLKLHHNREDPFDALLAVSPAGTADDTSDDFEITVSVDVQPKGDRPVFRNPKAAAFATGTEADHRIKVLDPDTADAGRQIACTLHGNSAAMPEGLALNRDCTITGTPSEAGTATVRITADTLGDEPVNGGISGARTVDYAVEVADVARPEVRPGVQNPREAVSGSEDEFEAERIDLGGIFSDPGGLDLGYRGWPPSKEIGVINYTISKGGMLSMTRVDNAHTGGDTEELEVYAYNGYVEGGPYVIPFDIEPVPDELVQTAHAISGTEGTDINLDASLYLWDPDTDRPGKGSFETVAVSGAFNPKKPASAPFDAVRLDAHGEEDFEAVLTVSPAGTAADGSDDFEVVIWVEVDPRGDRPRFESTSVTLPWGYHADREIGVYDPDSADAGRRIKCTIDNQFEPMPRGLVLNRNCTITGTPLHTGVTTVRITADTLGDEPVNGGINGARTVDYVINIAENRPPESITGRDSITIEYDEDAEAGPLDLNVLFDDPDGDRITYELWPKSGDLVLSAFRYKLDGVTGILEITLRPDSHTGGSTETLWVTTSDGMEYGKLFFLEVAVKPQNDRPEMRPGAPAGHTYLVGGGVPEVHEFDLSGIFRDVDGDELGYFVHPPSTHLGMADYEISDDGILSVTTDPGTAVPGTTETLRISARDGIDQSDGAYTITFSAGPADP